MDAAALIDIFDISNHDKSPAHAGLFSSPKQSLATVTSSNDDGASSGGATCGGDASPSICDANGGGASPSDGDASPSADGPSRDDGRGPSALLRA